MLFFLIISLSKNTYGFVFPNKDAYLSGMEQLKLTNYPVATEYFKTALKLDPENKDIIKALATTYEKSLEFEKANKLYEKAILDTSINQDQEKVEYLFKSGNNFFKMKRYLDAIDKYKKILKIDDKNISTKKNLELTIKKLNQENKEKNKSDKNSKQNKKDKSKNSTKKESKSAKNNSKQSKLPENQPKSGSDTKSDFNESEFKDENKSSINLKRANEILKNFSENQLNTKGFKFYKKEKSNKKNQKNW